MLSSSIEIFQRKDEAKDCRYANAYRYARSVKNNDEVTSEVTINDAETLTSDEM